MTNNYTPMLEYHFSVDFGRGVHPMVVKWEHGQDTNKWHTVRHLVYGIADIPRDIAPLNIKLMNATGDGPREDRHNVPILAAAIHDIATNAKVCHASAGYCIDENDAINNLGKYRHGITTIVEMVDRAIQNYESQDGDIEKLRLKELMLGNITTSTGDY